MKRTARTIEARLQNHLAYGKTSRSLFHISRLLGRLEKATVPPLTLHPNSRLPFWAALLWNEGSDVEWHNSAVALLRGAGISLDTSLPASRGLPADVFGEAMRTVKRSWTKAVNPVVLSVIARQQDLQSWPSRQRLVRGLDWLKRFVDEQACLDLRNQGNGNSVHSWINALMEVVPELRTGVGGHEVWELLLGRSKAAMQTKGSLLLLRHALSAGLDPNIPLNVSGDAESRVLPGWAVGASLGLFNGNILLLKELIAPAFDVAVDKGLGPQKLIPDEAALEWLLEHGLKRANGLARGTEELFYQLEHLGVRWPLGPDGLALTEKERAFVAAGMGAVLFEKVERRARADSMDSCLPLPSPQRNIKPRF